MLKLTSNGRVRLAIRCIILLDDYRIFLHDIGRDRAINILAVGQRIFGKLASKLVDASVCIDSILFVGRPLGQVIWIIVYHRNYCRADNIQNQRISQIPSLYQQSAIRNQKQNGGTVNINGWLVYIILLTCTQFRTQQLITIYIQMKPILRFLGRLLFVTLLISSAVIKIKQPTSYVSLVTNGYNTVRGLHSSVSDVLPSSTTINSNLPFPTIVRIIGAFEALIALLIVFGDRLGGLLLFVYLAVHGISSYAPTILTAVSKQRIVDLVPLLPQLTAFATLLGFSLVFMSRRVVKKLPIKA